MSDSDALPTEALYDHTRLGDLAVSPSGDRVAYVGHQYGDDSALDWFIVFAELKEGKISYYMSALVKGVTVSD